MDEQIDKVGSDLLGVDVKTQEEKVEEVVDNTDPKEMEEEIGEPPVGTGNPPQLDNNFYIENLPDVINRVKEENEEKKLNPSLILDGEMGINFIDGEPHIVIDNEYVPHDKALITLQTRKVVREYLKLQNLINGVKE